MATVWPLQLFCDVRCAVLDVLISDILLSNHISILANRSAYETQRNRRTGSSFILRTAHQLPLLAFFFFFFFFMHLMITPVCAIFNFIKFLSADFFFRIFMRRCFSLPGTSLASRLSHLNVFNLRRIAKSFK